MEFAGEDYFRFMAYERAADAVYNAPPLADLIAGGELTSLPGIGKSIAEKIGAILETGTCEYLEELRAQYPPRLMEVLTVPGIGIKTARMLFEQFEIGSLADLERALDSGTLAGAPRLGKKSLENLRRGILASKGRSRRWPLGVARPIADELIEYLRANVPARSLMRGRKLAAQRTDRRRHRHHLHVRRTRGRYQSVHGIFARASRRRGRLDQGEHLARNRTADRFARAAGASFRQSAAAFHGQPRAQHSAARNGGSQEFARERKRDSQSRNGRQHHVRNRRGSLRGPRARVHSAGAATRSRRDRCRA